MICLSGISTIQLSSSHSCHKNKSKIQKKKKKKRSKKPPPYPVVAEVIEDKNLQNVVTDKNAQDAAKRISQKYKKIRNKKGT